MKSYETIRCHCLCDVCGGDTVGHENIINSHTFNNISAHCSLIRVVDITASVKFFLWLQRPKVIKSHICIIINTREAPPLPPSSPTHLTLLLRVKGDAGTREETWESNEAAAQLWRRWRRPRCPWSLLSSSDIVPFRKALRLVSDFRNARSLPAVISEALPGRLAHTEQKTW